MSLMQINRRDEKLIANRFSCERGENYIKNTEDLSTQM